ncbi:2921_t:CDS:1 [Funneliformis geosporum]|uniref:2594_t:CDS:1 n=1 Tax=Funneliformis geosporum TaxID=1117311 RepID=A0A9W4SCR0_9GLOM|nr:2594_t:CDS:1 [Funneliformis geosporum]CAI2175560.1 2921_t:CDS:1 [Funneliformis geosporum]
MDVIEFVVNNINNTTCEFKREVAKLLQAFIINGNLVFPIADPQAMYENLIYKNRQNPRVKTTNMRNTLRYFVSQIQTTNNEHAVSKATDMLMRVATTQEKLYYKNLSDVVNKNIKSHR